MQGCVTLRHRPAWSIFLIATLTPTRRPSTRKSVRSICRRNGRSAGAGTGWPGSTTTPTGAAWSNGCLALNIMPTAGFSGWCFTTSKRLPIRKRGCSSCNSNSTVFRASDRILSIRCDGISPATRRRTSFVRGRAMFLIGETPYRPGPRTAAAPMHTKLLNRFALACMLVSGSALAVAQPAAERITLADRIVAVVNNEVITQRGLEERVQTVVRQLERSGAALPPRDVLERQILERMIVDHAQLQFARESGIRVDDATVDAAIARIATNNQLSVAEFRETLARDGIPYDGFREDIRAEITLSRLREREIYGRIQVSESEVDNFLAEQQDQDVDAEYLLSHILVRVPER